MGNRRFPSVSPSTKAKEPVCDWLDDNPNISNFIFFTSLNVKICVKLFDLLELGFYLFDCLIASVNFGSTSNASPTMP